MHELTVGYFRVRKKEGRGVSTETVLEGPGRAELPGAQGRLETALIPFRGLARQNQSCGSGERWPAWALGLEEASWLPGFLDAGWGATQAGFSTKCGRLE